ncbi:uncharacterized protein V1518DRAFT_378695 [Limtongia smithiae]|uniref:uncharacterized protein n=1 Tax=Limtongia smithiae TaxID=1125753 RepID=UPI0034CDF86E
MTDTSPPPLQRSAHLKLPPPLVFTFDAFGTIYTPRPSVAAQYAGAYATHFPRPPPPTDVAKVSRAFYAAFKERASAFPNYGGGESEWWYAVIRGTLRRIAESDPDFDLTGGEVAKSPASIEQILDDSGVVGELYEQFNSGKAYVLWNDIVPFLDTATGGTTRTMIGVISNSDRRSRDVLRGVGMLATITAMAPERMSTTVAPAPWIREDGDVILSVEVGCEKPDPAIFRAAAKHFSQDPIPVNATTSDDPVAVAKSITHWHIGDEYKKDIAPVLLPQLQSWGAVFVRRDEYNDSGISTPGGTVFLRHGGRVLEVTDLRDVAAVWASDGVSVIIDD